MADGSHLFLFHSSSDQLFSTAGMEYFNLISIHFLLVFKIFGLISLFVCGSSSVNPLSLTL